MNEIIERIAGLAGPQRALTFCTAVKAAIDIGAKVYVETGCYRGIAGDGMSTLILGMVAKETGGRVLSFDIYEGAVSKARELAAGLPVEVECVDSVDGIRKMAGPIDMLYLDSYDYEEKDPGPCQAHQLLEAAAALPKMAARGVILLDDCSLPGGGKARLADILIRAMGWQQWRPDAQLYQNIYFRG